MKQTTLSVVLEIQPASVATLEELIDKIRCEEETKNNKYIEQYGRIKSNIPALHFMSMCVFSAAEYDPVLIIEVNFDGACDLFWPRFEATFGEQLRPVIRCCKRPSNNACPLYDAVTRPGSSAPITPYLQARRIKPSVFHHGNRGLSTERILKEAALFIGSRNELRERNPGSSNPYRGLAAAAIHEKLRASLKQAHPWLDEPEPARISPTERAWDVAKLLAFFFAVLAGLSVPGIVMALVAPPGRFVVLFGLALLVVYYFLNRMRAPLAGTKTLARSGALTPESLSRENPGTSFANPFTFTLAIVGLLALYLFVASLVGTILMIGVSGKSFAELWWATFQTIFRGLASGLVVTVPVVVLWLRILERGDSSHDDPSVDPKLLSEMAHREDRIAQNHMGSVVLIKPGVLRMVLIRVGHLGLGLLLRVLATDGYLGSMRTVHFAHWAFISNGSRLLFFSNFDHSWESYLDDFIEKAHGGLTLAWGGGTGFPPTRLLVLDGASHGRAFKAWARHSMVVNRFWYSAYKSLTVDQIERQARVASGLRRPSLSPEEAVIWARDL